MYVFYFEICIVRKKILLEPCIPIPYHFVSLVAFHMNNYGWKKNFINFKFLKLKSNLRNVANLHISSI